jgi:DNA-binding response OmpR family regulator
MSRILLLEPSHLLARQYQTVLKRAGHEVVWCRDGQSAIVAADANAPDLLVVELLLAGHSGLEFIYEFRTYSDWQHVPVIVLTGVPQSDFGADAALLNDLGVSAYLYKAETSLAQLTRAVNRAIGAGAGQV